MTRSFLLTAVSLSVLCAAAQIDPNDVWFFADFDRSIQVNGRMLPHEAPDDAYVQGRFGKGLFFRRCAVNNLPAMGDFVVSTNSFDALGGASPVGDAAVGTLSYAGGEFLVRPRKSGVVSHYTSCSGLSLFAFEVKGTAGTVVTLTPECPPLSEKQIAERKKKDKEFDLLTCCKDNGEARTFVLTGDWQRVSNAYRLCSKLRERRVGWRVKASGPIVMRKFLQQGAASFPYGDISQPTEWVDGGMTRAEYPVLCKDIETLRTFPASNGTFSCWLKTPSDWVPASRLLPLFCCGYSMDKAWMFNGNVFTPVAGSLWLSKCWQARKDDWQLVTATWTPDESAVYINGKRVVGRKNPSLLVIDRPGAVLQLGQVFYQGAADAIVDEVAILKRALSGSEVQALYEAKSGLMEGRGEFLAAPPAFAVFPRNQDVAELAFDVDAPRGGTFSVTLIIGDVVLPAQSVVLRVGHNRLSVPFRPADFHGGRYPWRVELKEKSGECVLAHTGEVGILPRLNREDFRLQSWSFEPGLRSFYAQIGMNAVVCPVTSKDLAALAANHGFHLTLRIENSSLWRSCGMNLERMCADVRKLLAPYSGLPMWDSTLVNSETYGVWLGKPAAENEKWLAWARKELGFEPKIGFTGAPCGVSWGMFGMKCPSGIMLPNEPFTTLDWFMRRGMPSLVVNGVNRKVVHELSPGNVVWSEPSPSPSSLDMTADWIYNYNPSECLYLLRRCGSVPRANGKRYLPTLAMGYWTPDFPTIQTNHPSLKEPASDKPLKCSMAQTVDELKIKSWMCLGGAACDGLSYFSADWCWQQAMTNGILQESGLPLVKCPGWQKYYIAEKDCATRFGDFVRRDFYPAAQLLKNMPNRRANVAILLAKEVDYSGQFWWPRVFYPKFLGCALDRIGVAYDVISDNAEYTVENLGQYDYILYPQLNCITPEHDKVLRTLPSKTLVLVDNIYRGKWAGLDYPNVEKVNDLSYGNKTDEQVNRPLANYFTDKRDSLRRGLAAWSDQDGENAWTFCKEWKGVHYVTVVNNLRRKGGCPQTTVYTDDHYRPMGAPQRIVTHFNVPGVIYAFNGGGVLQGPTVTRDYAAASACVYCVYPKALAKPMLVLDGMPQSGGEVKLDVKIADVDGAPAPGRQVVRFVLRDPNGRMADESGLYVVEGGKGSILLRFARADKTGGSISKWKAVVIDLTTGQECSLAFVLKN